MTLTPDPYPYPCAISYPLSSNSNAHPAKLNRVFRRFGPGSARGAPTPKSHPPNPRIPSNRISKPLSRNSNAGQVFHMIVQRLFSGSLNSEIPTHESPQPLSRNPHAGQVFHMIGQRLFSGRVAVAQAAMSFRTAPALSLSLTLTGIVTCCLSLASLLPRVGLVLCYSCVETGMANVLPYRPL